MIDQDRTDLFVAIELEADVFANHAPEHLLQPADVHVEIERHGTAHLFAAQGEQLPCERRGRLGRILYVGEIREEAVGDVRARERLLQIAEDDGEQVVEIVRDASGKASDGLELLRL